MGIISSRATFLLSIPALIITAACASTEGRHRARTSPEGEPAGPVAVPAAVAETTPTLPHAVTASPAVEPSPSDRAESIVTRAEEEYDQGLEALKAGQTEEARARFDAAIDIFLNSGVPLDQDARLRRAYDKMVEDIAALENDLEESAPESPDATPSPTEQLESVTPDLSPEEARKELEKVAPEVAEITFDIPIVTNDKVLAWIEIFKTRKPFQDAFIGGYQRYGWYEEMIRGIFREEGVPTDLIYMAFLESTYKTSAYSRARARGIWQFITPTGREYGLKITRYLDERSHPEKSTRAAARYLKDLYATFGDWHLAMAGYNTGAGNILRAQRRSGKKDFWDLARTKYLRTETKNYVPAIIALALIAKDPAKYGYAGVQHNATLRYDRVTVESPTTVALMARLAGVTEEEIRFLNPQLRLGVTPPGVTEYEVLVPEGRGGTFTVAYAELPEEERAAKIARLHTVRRGETLASIASRYGTSVNELKAANGIRNANRLSVGAQLTVPNVHGVLTTADDPDVNDFRGKRRGRTSRYGAYHVVRRGDTLSGISRSYGVSVRSLMAWNGLDRASVLMPGRRLRVGRDAAHSGVRSVGTRPASPAPPTAGLVSVPGGGQTPPDPAGERISYRVRRGDNLFRIALKFRTTVDSLKAWNNLANDAIRVGETLVIYPN